MNQPQAAHLQASDGPVIKQMKGTHVMSTHQVPSPPQEATVGKGAVLPTLKPALIALKSRRQLQGRGSRCTDFSIEDG